MGSWHVYEDLTDVIKYSWHSRRGEQQAQQAQKNRGTVGTEEQKNSTHRGTGEP